MAQFFRQEERSTMRTMLALCWSGAARVLVMFGCCAFAGGCSKSPSTLNNGQMTPMIGAAAGASAGIGATTTAGTTATGNAGAGAVSGGRGSIIAGVGASAGIGGTAGIGSTAGTGRNASAGVGGAADGGTAGTGLAGTGSATAGGGAAPTSGAASVLQHHNDSGRTGRYVDGALTRSAVANLRKDAAFVATIAGPTYAQPLYLDAGPGGKDLVITATEQNEVTAFNAADGMVVWRKTLAPPAPLSSLPCGRINPLGVTGTPVIDAQSRTLYVAAMTMGPKHQIFALSLDDGAMRQGWPVDVDTVRAGSRAFASAVHNQRGALLLLDNTLYVPYGGHLGDCGDYHGWVVGVPLDNPSAPIGFATQAHAGGIWGPGGLASDGASVFAATGNTMSDLGGAFSTPLTWGHGNAILRLSKGLANISESQTRDFFAPDNWSALDAQDYDLGGSGPVLFTAPGSTPSDLAMALGKDGAAYLLDRSNLGGMGGMIQRRMVAGGGSTGGIIQAAAAYNTPSGTFVAFRSVMPLTGCAMGMGYLGAIKVAGTPPSMTLAWCAGGNGASSPMVTTTDGMNESVVWYMAGGRLLGFNGETGAAVFTGGGTSDALGSFASFQTPIAAKGRIFVAAANQLLAFTP
jgi:hypothetical protein